MIGVSERHPPTHPGAVRVPDDQLPRSEDVAPVADALLEIARRHGIARRTAGERQARDFLAAARAAADAQLVAARAEGNQLAERAAAARMATAHREARQRVLFARRRAHEKLRRCSAALLLQQSDSAAGQALITYLMAKASDRAGGAPAARRQGERTWVIVAESDGRRAELDAGTLIDQFLPSFAARVDAL
jgi:hypothetical protein